jgi:hypothetical protein
MLDGRNGGTVRIQLLREGTMPKAVTLIGCARPASGIPITRTN